MTSVAHRAGRALLRRGRGSFRVILTRYALGSVIAAVVSELTLLLVYGLRLGGPVAAAVCAWIGGSLVNYFLNRNWAWGRSGRAHPVRELLPYWLAALASLGASTWATSAADRMAPALTGGDHGLTVVVVGIAFLVTYGVLFVAKFLLFHYVLFTPRPAPAGGASTTL